MRLLFSALLVACSCTAFAQPKKQEAPVVGFRPGASEIVITVDEKPVATYVFADENIPRPYFAHVKAPGGLQVTRNHPPVQGKDQTDHQRMHPGIWMAFGDLGGADFWRNKARVVHKRFIAEPKGGPRNGSFHEEKHYLRPDGTLVCRERFECSLRARPSDYLLLWDSTFSSDAEFYFGDQEEMGLGIRVATAISEVKGGQLRDAQARSGAKQIWSNAADWCDYGGSVGEHRIGMTLLCHPDNFRPSWMHARDYGLLAANPFGRQAMGKGRPSRVVVKPGETLRLRYGILIYAARGSQPDLHAAYTDYVQLAAGNAHSIRGGAR